MSNDNAETAHSGPTDEAIKKHLDTISTVTQKAADAQSPVQEAYKRAEEAGVNRAAAKFVLKLSRMDPVKRQTLLRDIDRYIDVYGLNDQSEMFEEDERQAINDTGIGGDQDDDDEVDTDLADVDEDEDEYAVA